MHDAGKDYRHYIEATWFGIPLLKVNEGYVDGQSFFESPMGAVYDDASTNQGANLAIWAEAGWFPSIWITDPRVRWEAIDDKTALLFVPFENQKENFVVRFDLETGLIDSMEAMRYRDSARRQRRFCGSPGMYHQKRLKERNSIPWVTPHGSIRGNPGRPSHWKRLNIM